MREDPDIVFSRNEGNMFVEISGVMTDEYEDRPEHSRYKIYGRVKNGTYDRTFMVFSDHTTNEFQKKNKKTRSERDCVIDRLHEQLKDCSVPLSWYRECLSLLRNEGTAIV